MTSGARDDATPRQCGTLDAAQWPRAARQVGGGGDVSAAAASLKAASSTAVKSKCSPGERCAGPGARITFVLRSRAIASRLTPTPLCALQCTLPTSLTTEYSGVSYGRCRLLLPLWPEFQNFVQKFFCIFGFK